MLPKPRNVIFIVCMLTTSFAAAQEWPQFRGPNGSGVSDAKSIPLKWTDADYAWKIELPGGGHSSPVLWGDRVFVTCGDSASGKRMILCVNAANGQILWKREYPGKTFRMHQDNSYASASPAADEARVYFCWFSPEASQLIALDHDGKDAWSVELGPFIAQHGGGASPMIFGELVILANDQEGAPSFIIGVDRKTGQVKWKLPRKSSSAATSTPCVFAKPGQPPQLIVTSRTEGVAAIDPVKGERIWQLADILDRRVVSSPIVAGDLVIAACGEGGVGRTLVAVRPGSKDELAKIAWKITAKPPYVPTPLFKNNKLFLWGDAGVIECIDPTSGKPLGQLNLGAPFYGSPVWIDGRLYAVSRRGEMFVVSAAEKPALLARFALGEPSFATPAVAGGRIYLRTFKHLMCVGTAR